MKTLIKLLCLSVLWFSCESSTEPQDVYGCTDDTACNFNPDANIFDNSCNYGIDNNEECCDEIEIDDCGICNGDNSSCAFSLEIQLLENDLPVAGIETYINHIFSNQNFINYRGTTSFSYQVPSAGQVFLHLDDLDNNIIDTLIYSMLDASTYYYSLITEEELAPTGISVFSIVLDSDNGIDSKYAVFVPGYDFNTLTSFYTNESGLITINNQSWFPSLYNLPEILYTDESGNELGNFNVDNFIEKIQVIFLYNDEYRSFDLNLSNYKNEYIFNWEDGDSFYPNMSQNTTKLINKNIINTNSKDNTLNRSLLSDPYPNPYN